MSWPLRIATLSKGVSALALRDRAGTLIRDRGGNLILTRS